MKIKEIFELEPLKADLDSGLELSIRKLIERYYKPHFPKVYKRLADNYVREIQELSGEGEPQEVFFVWSCWCDGYSNIDVLLGVFDQESMAVDYAKEYIVGKTFEHDAVVTTGRVNEKSTVSSPYSNILHSFPGTYKEPEENDE